MAQLYRTNGTIEEYPEPANGTDYTLEEMQAAIGGGYVQILATIDGRIMIVDEEGKLKGFSRNEAASREVILFAGDYISGDALVCEKSQIQ